MCLACKSIHENLLLKVARVRHFNAAYSCTTLAVFTHLSSFYVPDVHCSSLVFLYIYRLLSDVFIAISNARLALLVKDIESTWTNLVAIFASIPRMVCGKN